MCEPTSFNQTNQTLENELGYSLFERKKGQKKISLTDKGTAFISVANRWKDLWQEALDIKEMDHSALLKISSINSVATYILPEVFRNLSKEPENIQICFHHCHSFQMSLLEDFLSWKDTWAIAPASVAM